MRIHKKFWNIQEIHITSWLFKDIFWCLKFTWMATFMVFPTAALTIYILLTEKENKDSNITLASWVFMNIFWMLHELQNFYFGFVYVFMFLGILNTFRLIFKRIKNESNLS